MFCTRILGAGETIWTELRLTVVVADGRQAEVEDLVHRRMHAGVDPNWRP